MKFIKYHWNRLERGSTIVVTLSTAANVRLMDGANFSAYKNGRKHRYTGGLVTKSPFRFTVPRTGSWYVTIDLQGLKAANIRHSAAVEPPRLPVARSSPLPSASGIRHETSLSGIRHELPQESTRESVQTWDVFVSHAHEDKKAIAEPLAEELRARGLEVWLDKTELRIGDSLRRKIDQGLAKSTFGIVILSKSFFAKEWTQYELDGIIGRSVNGEQRLLPIWHEISHDEIIDQAPSLADKIARNTATNTVAEIADEIAAVVNEA